MDEPVEPTAPAASAGLSVEDQVALVQSQVTALGQTVTTMDGQAHRLALRVGVAEQKVLDLQGKFEQLSDWLEAIHDEVTGAPDGPGSRDAEVNRLRRSGFHTSQSRTDGGEFRVLVKMDHGWFWRFTRDDGTTVDGAYVETGEQATAQAMVLYNFMPEARLSPEWISRRHLRGAARRARDEGPDSPPPGD